jgi:hypothetical protein
MSHGAAGVRARCAQMRVGARAGSIAAKLEA